MHLLLIHINNNLQNSILQNLHNFFSTGKTSERGKEVTIDSRIFAQQHKLQPDKYISEMSKHQA